jgi:hypothetical protein
MGRNRPHSDTTGCITRSDGAQNSQIDVLFEVPNCINGMAIIGGRAGRR